MKKDQVFFILSGFFITNALLANLAGSKLINLGPFTATVGVLLWPIVFVATDVINEYFGKPGVRKLTFLTAGLIVYSYIALELMMSFPAASVSTLTDENYNAVFGESKWIITGSTVAFMVSQLVDVGVFWFLRYLTGAKFIWLRATGSTLVSQLIDTFVVLGIAFWLPGTWDFGQYIDISMSNYTYKVLFAIGATPFIYLAHALIERYLGDELAERITTKVAEENKDSYKEIL